MAYSDVTDTVAIESERGGKRRSAVVTLACVLLAAILFVGGREVIHARASSVDEPGLEPPVTVSVSSAALQSFYPHISKHTGLVEPGRQTDLAFESGGTVIDVLVREGERVRRGSLIARLDTRSLRAERAAQEAQRLALQSDLERARLTFQRQQSLEDRNFAAEQSTDDARLSVARSEALIQQLDATISTIDVALDKAELRAPFDAEVGRRWVDEGSTVSSGSPIASLLEWAKPQARIGLPVDITRSLSEVSEYSITVDDVAYPAKVVAKRHDLSTRTRTLDVLFALDATDLPAPTFGQTAELSLTQRVESKVYRVPVTALTEGEAGLWSLLVAVPDEPGTTMGRVIRESVAIVHTDGVQAYVQAQLASGAQIIQAGPHRVVVGQRIQSIAEE